MAGNSRFATAIHVAGMLSFADQMPMTSEMIAQSCNTNPVVIRRIIGSLAKSGIVKVKMGTGGGASLSRKPEEVTLAEIYKSLEEGTLFDVPQFDEAFHCEVGKIVRPVLADILKDAEKSLIYSLKQTSLADVIQTVKNKIANKSAEKSVCEVN